MFDLFRSRMGVVNNSTGGTVVALCLPMVTEIRFRV
jgi:hypothetical protein